jgi:hypothetical protein
MKPNTQVYKNYTLKKREGGAEDEKIVMIGINTG